jgi:hypothetical protein
MTVIPQSFLFKHYELWQGILVRKDYTTFRALEFNLLKPSTAGPDCRPKPDGCGFPEYANANEICYSSGCSDDEAHWPRPHHLSFAYIRFPAVLTVLPIFESVYGNSRQPI